MTAIDPSETGQKAPPAGELTISVVMIVRNGAAFIEEALASVTASRRQPLEILVIDGGSTDATAEIAGRHPLAIVIPQEGTGIANAYNQGIRACRGDVIAFLSHDDLWAPGKLDLQLAALDADPELLLTFGLVRHQLIGPPPPGFRLDLLERDVPGYLMETMIARRRAFELVGEFDPSFATAEDVDWIARARDMKLPTALIPEVILIKRIHGNNSSLVDPDGTSHLLRALRGKLARRAADRG